MKKNLRMLLAAFAVAALPWLLTDVASAQPPTANQFWWPNQLDLSPLRQHSVSKRLR